MKINHGLVSVVSMFWRILWQRNKKILQLLTSDSFENIYSYYFWIKRGFLFLGNLCISTVSAHPSFSLSPLCVSAPSTCAKVT